jgi:acetyl esterase/lipase
MARPRTHYYAGNARFEQSLDVYTPAYPEAAGCEPLPLVVLVIGSAWCGHRHFIYGGTSWWNSAGPKTVASLGAVCVCIRHRGAFPPPPTSLLGALLVACLLAPLLPQHPLLLLGALLLLAWHPLARGAATHEQMIDDVASALLWVRAHRTELVAAPGAAPPAKMVFGGYSSGAHVAMCLLQRPDLLAARGLPPPAELCDGVLLLSGVLGTRLTCGAAAAPQGAPALTNSVSRMVFGATAAEALPSPVHDVAASPTLPHLLVCCEHELFGLPLLEEGMSVYFATREMAARLARRWCRAPRVACSAAPCRTALLRTAPPRARVPPTAPPSLPPALPRPGGYPRGSCCSSRTTGSYSARARSRAHCARACQRSWVARWWGGRVNRGRPGEGG